MTKRVLFGLLITFGGALAINSGWLHLERTLASESWPTAAGEIKTSGVSTKTVRAAGPARARFEPEVVYTYTVDGRPYESRAIWAGSEGISYGERSHAREVAARYPVGQAVTVYYDPSSPVRTALEQDAEVTVYLLLAIGALSVGAGIWLMAAPLKTSIVAAWTEESRSTQPR